MENFLRSKEYWHVVESGVATPTTAMTVTEGQQSSTSMALIKAQRVELEGLKLKDLKAKNYLFQAINRPILETILCKDTSKDNWDSMKKKYQDSSRVKRS